MTLLQAIVGFAGIAALITVLPGLDTALVLRSAATAGRRGAAWTAAGICTGLTAWGAATAVGLAALLAASASAYAVVRLVGALYLLVIGIRLVITATQHRAGNAGTVGAPETAQPGARRAWLTGVTTNLLNPKVGVFYLAVIPQFLVAGMPPLLTGLLLAGVHAALTACWSGALLLAASAAARQLRRPLVRRWVDGVTGGVLIAFGVRTALEH